MGYYLLTS